MYLKFKKKAYFWRVDKKCFRVAKVAHTFGLTGRLKHKWGRHFVYDHEKRNDRTLDRQR